MSLWNLLQSFLPKTTTKVDHIDWSFISRREGYSLNGYVPMRNGAVDGNSGVTILSGFDLGQHNQGSLEAMGLSYHVVEVLLPYLGLKGQQAVDYLSQHPLRLNDTDASEITYKLRTQFTADLNDAYNEASNSNFFELSPAQQTVIASVAYQYGLNLAKRTPHFWEACCSHLWDVVISILQNFGDAYQSRHDLEAQLLIDERNN